MWIQKYHEIINIFHNHNLQKNLVLINANKYLVLVYKSLTIVRITEMYYVGPAVPVTP